MERRGSTAQKTQHKRRVEKSRREQVDEYKEHRINSTLDTGGEIRRAEEKIDECVEKMKTTGHK